MILLVEDNKDDEYLAVRALEKHRMAKAIVIARDGAEAVDYLFGTGGYEGRDIGMQPRVVFLDLQLPKLTGLDVLATIRGDARTKHLPVVILTSSKEEEDIRRSYALGANSYLRKPVDFGEFSETVRLAAAYWLTLNEVMASPPVR
jgi:two-component system, response regulator